MNQREIATRILHDIATCIKFWPNRVLATTTTETIRDGDFMEEVTIKVRFGKPVGGDRR